MDSLYFEVFQGTWDPQFFELQWSVNRFTEQSFVPYTDGVWLKDRNYTENTWENLHMQESGDGSISEVTFTGVGSNTVSVVGINTTPEGMRVRLVVKENRPDGDIFDAYVHTPDGLQFAVSTQPAVDFPGPPYLLDSEDGWMVQFDQGFGHTVGDYWEWEVSGFGSDKSCNYPSDFNQPRGQLLKVNTIRIRLIEKSTGRITQEEVSIIGFGQQPHGHHILFATADSSDVVEVLGASSSDDIRRNVYLHILHPNGTVEFHGKVEWDKAANFSGCLPNHGVAFKARGSIGAKNMTTSIFGQMEKVDKIKMRVGGNAQAKGFGSHEIALNILDDVNLKLLGGVQNSVATWYLNGSYWSLGFPQEQPRKRFYERVLDVEKEDVDIMEIIPHVNVLYHDMYSDSSQYGNYVLFHEKTELQLFGEKIGEYVFLPKDFFDFSESINVYNPFESCYEVFGFMKDGTSINFKNKLQLLVNLFNKSIVNQFDLYSVKSVIDLDWENWVKILSSYHFFNLYDVTSRNTNLGTTSNGKIFPIGTDFDKTGVEYYYSNYLNSSNWNYLFSGKENYHYGIIHIILSLIHSSPSAMSRLALVYQDLLNTALLPERTTAIVDEMRNAVMPEYGRMHASWGGSPNGGQSPEGQEQLFATMRNFYAERPAYAFQLMADYIMPDEGFVLEDRNSVNIVFDSIPEGIVEVSFNSLTLYENFSGLYFPKPYVEISYVVKEGYNVIIKEYPELSDSFTLGADSTISITFVMRKDSVVNSIKEGWSPPLEIYPNPVQHELFLNGLVEDNLSYSIVSALGSVVVDQLPLHSQNIPVDFLPVGSYFLRVESGNDFVVRKFLKN